VGPGVQIICGAMEELDEERFRRLCSCVNRGLEEELMGVPEAESRSFVTGPATRTEVVTC
jgi:hypothetical protein